MAENVKDDFSTDEIFDFHYTEDLSLTNFVKQINCLVEDPIKPMDLSDWLFSHGYTSKQEKTSGRLPTEKGRAIGMYTIENSKSPTRKYKSVYYNKQAQEFVLKHLDEILILLE